LPNDHLVYDLQNIVDEPTSAVDSEAKNNAIKIIKDISKKCILSIKSQFDFTYADFFK
jgi:ABC-type Mn2+/Zn2+ transport system ATPase subunit